METTLYDWATQAAGELGLDDERRWVGERDTVAWVLDLAKDVARGVARPAAPVGAFLAGVAVGLAGAEDPAELERIRAQVAATLPADASG